MARGITAAITLLALAMAGTAMAEGPLKTQAYKASFELGGSISFQRHGGRAPTVDEIMIEDISVQCDPGSGYLDFEIYGDTPVLDDRSFTVRSKDRTGGKAKVSGRFNRKYTAAKGTARVYGKFPAQDGSVRCDSGKQKFVAR